MVDKMFQQIIDKGLKPSTAAGAKRVLSVALSHARKYRYIETNAAKDTLTKFWKRATRPPTRYTPEQVKALMQRVEGTVWEMPVILGGLYGMRRSEIWACVGVTWIWKTTPLTLPSSYLSKCPTENKMSLKKWHRRNPTAGSYPLPSLPVRSSSNSLPCRKRSANRQRKTASPIMTMTLLWQNRTARLSPLLGYLHSVESCLKIWICRISAFTICAIPQLPICTTDGRLLHRRRNIRTYACGYRRIAWAVYEL